MLQYGMQLSFCENQYKLTPSNNYCEANEVYSAVHCYHEGM